MGHILSLIYKLVDSIATRWTINYLYTVIHFISLNDIKNVSIWKYLKLLKIPKILKILKIQKSKCIGKNSWFSIQNHWIKRFMMT